MKKILLIVIALIVAALVVTFVLKPGPANQRSFMGVARDLND